MPTPPPWFTLLPPLIVGLGSGFLDGYACGPFFLWGMACYLCGNLLSDWLQANYARTDAP